MVGLGFLLGSFVIRGPAGFSSGGGSEERRDRGDGENSPKIFHATTLGQTKALRKLSRNTRSGQFRYKTSPAVERRAKKRIGKSYDLMCPETSLVISNMLTWLLPLKTGLSESSALIMVLFFLSWHPFFLM